MERACHPVSSCTSSLHEHALSSLSSLTLVDRTPYRCDLLRRSNLHHPSSGMCAFLNVIDPAGLTPRTTMQYNLAPSSSTWPVASCTLGLTQQSIFLPFYTVALWILAPTEVSLANRLLVLQTTLALHSISTPRPCSIAPTIALDSRSRVPQQCSRDPQSRCTLIRRGADGPASPVR